MADELTNKFSAKAAENARDIWSYNRSSTFGVFQSQEFVKADKPDTQPLQSLNFG